MRLRFAGEFSVLLALMLSGLGVAQEPQSAWKHQIGVPEDPFQSWTSPAYVKFTIIIKAGYDPNLVYFQDSSLYEYHFDFALKHLDPFTGMSLEEFDAVTLHAAGQQAVLGAVILPPWGDPPIQEYGIQLARIDPYTREQTVRLFNLVKASVVADPNMNMKAYYFPTYEQYPVAQQNREWFEAQGVPVGSTAQWTQGNASYSQGWALGTLKFVSGAEIQQAYTAGSLACNDILLTDGVPAEVPSLAGIVTLAASTPNSHVAILSRSQGVPFVHLAEESDASRAKSLVGKSVYLAVTQSEFSQTCEVKLYDVGSLDETDRVSLLALKKGPPLVIQPMALRGGLWADTNDLSPADIRFFGGKASNFGILRRSFPSDSPAAMAFSFDLWNAFLDQRLSLPAGDKTLRDVVRNRLAKYATYPPADLEALSKDLASIRDLFKDTQTTHFGQVGTEVVNALRSFRFDPGRNIRFRSSTNVEDSDQFTGAGLYDSFSGCLADDEDGDDTGPCACDSAEKNERGVFRAIRKVFASFYNDNAFLERRKHDVNEAEVGMALLVHHSFPDETELANGVATLERSFDQSWSASVVSQKGAVSVTNPPTDAVPEEVRIEAWGSEVMPQVNRRSSLVSLRENTVLEWDAEYVKLYGLLVAAAQRYCQETQKDDIVLDFEFKKIAPEGKLVIKQIREIPQAGGAGYATPFLFGDSRTYWTLQGRGGNVFTNHRLKSRWTLRPRSTWLSEESLKQCIYDEAAIEYVADGQVRQVVAKLSSLPNASHVYELPQSEYESPALVDGWKFADLTNPRAYSLRTTPMFHSPTPDPVVTLGDFRLDLEVACERPVSVDLNDVRTDQPESLMLYHPWIATAADPIEECSLDDPNTGVSVHTRIYSRWSWDWTTPTSVQFESTRIEGLTTEPIVLTGYFSQSVGGGAHLCPKNFLFEPGLEPGVSQQTLDELRARNVRLIYFTTGARECRPTEKDDTPPLIRLLGFDQPIE
ncbi:MAG: PEP/pyruvate-binding domain-containing protein [Phycisphaerales bacterium]